MSDRYEFLPSCFLSVSISSGYFIVILTGLLTPNVPRDFQADNATQILNVLDSRFTLSYLQYQEIANYLCSQGMEL